MVKAHMQTVLDLVSQHGPASESAGMSRGAPSVLECVCVCVRAGVKHPQLHQKNSNTQASVRTKLWVIHFAQHKTIMMEHTVKPECIQTLSTLSVYWL